MNDDKETNDETPLYLASFDQLADELTARYRLALCCVIAGEKTT